MKKIIFLCIAVLLVVNLCNISVAFAEIDLVYAIVRDTIKQIYNTEIENYEARDLNCGKFYCSFNGGYAIVEMQNCQPSIETICFEETEYFNNYWGAGTLTEQTYSIPYANKNEKNKSLALKNPNYTLGGVTCVPNAATCILGFYDRYYTELIPNFTAGKPVATNYMYYAEDNNVNSAALQLSYDMGLSNPATDGATVNKFKTGMQTYCARKNLNVNLTSCMSWGNFNYDGAISNLDSNTPLIIFTSTFSLASISTLNNTDTVTTYSSSATHAMAVFGYSEITYKLNDGTTRIDKYLRVASGVDFISNALVNVESNIIIDDAYAITIKG